MNGRRSLARLFGIAMLIVTIWVVFAAFNWSEFYRRSADLESTRLHDWLQVVYYQLWVALNWSLFTPVIVFIAERLPLIRPFRWTNAVALVVIMLPMAIVRAVFGGATLSIAEGGTLPEVVAFVIHSVNVRVHRNIFLIAMIVVAVNLILAQRAAAASERKSLTMKKEMADAELQRLRAAMQPRFFFATLAAVKAHMASQPAAADRMLVQLGGVLRAVLEFEKRRDVSLAEELKVVDQCLEIERIRTGHQFTTRIAVDRELLEARIPPLLLYTLVEHSILDHQVHPGHVEIEGDVEDGTLALVVRIDDPSRFPHAAAIQTTAAHLRGAFGDSAWFTWQVDDQGMVTVMTMPLRFLLKEAG